MAQRGSDGRFAAGSSGNPAGRPRGAVNKVTQELRVMVREALDEEGGTEYLRRCAREQPAQFMSLLGRLLPAEIKADLGDSALLVTVRDYTGRGSPLEPLEPPRLPESIEAGFKVAEESEREPAEAAEPATEPPRSALRPQGRPPSRADYDLVLGDDRPKKAVM